MATETTNYKFKKPDNTDFYNIADQNGNWDECDKQLKVLDDGKAATTHEHTKAEITDFPTKLPADGGDADTVGGVNINGFVRNLGVVGPQDVLAFADTIDGHQYLIFRMFNGTGVPTNHGYVDGDNDFWYTVSSIDKGNFVEISARDIRSNSTFYNVKLNGIWQGWTATNATTLGGKTEDKFMQYDVNNLATVNKLGGVNGGRLVIQRGDTNFTLGDAYVDYYNDSVRFWSAREGQAVGVKMKISDIPDSNFRNVAIFTSGTADITPGVTNIGKNILYIKYKA